MNMDLIILTHPTFDQALPEHESDLAARVSGLFHAMLRW